MPAPTFAVVAGLSLEEQRRLLQAGDGPERLWSAWSIALRLGRDALPLLRSTEGSDIPDGLRRQLLVVLAGMGERELLRTIADSEHSPSVQATASILYLRTAPDPSNAETLSFALRQLRTARVEVRRAIVGEHELEQASIPTRELYPTLRDPDPAVRIACAACVLKDPSSQAYPESVSALIAAFADERNSEVRGAFRAQLPRSAVPAILDAVRGDASRVLDELDAAIKRFGGLAWDEVRGIARSATLEVTRAILRSGVPLESSEAIGWLCDAIRASAQSTPDLRQEVNWHALYAIRPFLTEETVVSLAAYDRALLLTTFQRALVELGEHIDSYGADFDDDDYLQELASVVRVLG